MVQYALFERFMAQGLRRKERQLQRVAAATPARAPLAALPAVKMGPGEIFLIGEPYRKGGVLCVFYVAPAMNWHQQRAQAAMNSKLTVSKVPTST